ncbi:MAG: LysR family transcriptional regulator [Sedimentibacter sp.]
MNFFGIEAFLTIIETQSLSKAAEKLFLSQSTITHRLNSLEDELDVKLVKRGQGQRYITLTAKGEEFITIAKRWMSLQKDTDIWRTNEPKLTLSIGLVDSLSSYVFPPLFKNITELETELSLKISSHWSITICKLLESYEIDIGIVSRLIKSESIIAEPIFNEQMVLVSSSSYSNFGDVVHPKELEKRKELKLDWGENFQLWHDTWWDPLIPIDIIVDTSGLIFNLIDIPGSWAIVPLSVAHHFGNTMPIRISKLVDPPPERTLYKIKNRFTKPSRRESLRIFEDYLQDFIKNNPYLINVIS